LLRWYGFVNAVNSVTNFVRYLSISMENFGNEEAKENNSIFFLKEHNTI
jgi:hypothetical protein